MREAIKSALNQGNHAHQPHTHTHLAKVVHLLSKGGEIRALISSARERLEHGHQLHNAPLVRLHLASSLRLHLAHLLLASASETAYLVLELPQSLRLRRLTLAHLLQLHLLQLVL
jgi:hypothetical protein